MAMGKSMDDTPTFGNKQRWDNYVARWDWDEKNNFQQARFFGAVVTDFYHSVETKTGKRYPEFCHGWDIDNGKFYEDKEERCPCCALKIKGQYRFFINAIDVDAEENKPSKPKADWSPIRLVDVASTLFTRLKELKSVNKGFAITDPEHGAIVQIKFNKEADAANMYSGTMDTKDVPLTEEQKNYIVTQKYPNGNTEIVRGKNGLPAQFEYVRCVNSRDEMIKGLRRNGYYGETEEALAAAHSFDKPKERTLSREETVAQLDAEAPIETIEMDLSNVFAGGPAVVKQDEEPAPKKAAAKPTTPTKVKAIYDECPTAFGTFANHMDCYTLCGMTQECRDATAINESAASKPAPKPKEVVQVADDDDDTV